MRLRARGENFFQTPDGKSGRRLWREPVLPGGPLKTIRNPLQNPAMASTLVSNPYSDTHAIRQHHRNGCWAACLEWWCKCVLGTTGYTQDGIRQNSSVKSMYQSDSGTGTQYHTWSSRYGTLETNELLSLLQGGPWFLAASTVNNFNGAVLQTKLARGPVIVGFYDLSGNTWHVNVICNYDSSLDMALVMEPRKGKYMDKAMADFTVASNFNLLGWRL